MIWHRLVFLLFLPLGLGGIGNVPRVLGDFRESVYRLITRPSHAL